MFRVHDDRTNETLYQNKDNIESVAFVKCYVIIKFNFEELNIRKYLQNKKQATNKIDRLFCTAVC